MNNASFFQRFAAWLIDRVILSILYFLGSLAVGVVSAVYTSSRIDIPNLLLSVGVGVFMLVSILGDFLYFGYFWSRRERSIGMGIMNIRVVKTDGHPLSFIIAGLRGSVGYYVSGLCFGLGYIWFFVDKQHATWHDKIFNTVVST
ncbi:RDD family protein [Chamaesiphon sp. OTE_20_metabat_361]|uniref:RDD family protein n=1 Tax=Chamaesiphon sp. OTE_20_metabat_361 TaxID=2964689 RepID=UPI00286CA7EA|nr:RDD family protein [Chamaesiphon sp. OTE_20_metabat_361]